MSNILDPDQNLHSVSVGPDLGPNCLQMLSADEKNLLLAKKELKEGTNVPFHQNMVLKTIRICNGEIKFLSLPASEHPKHMFKLTHICLIHILSITNWNSQF